MPTETPLPDRCPGWAEAPLADHVLAPVLPVEGWPGGDATQPFVRYRQLLLAWWRWRALDRSDAEWADLVGRLDDAVAAIDGRGFRITPVEEHDDLIPGARAFVKDETRNVSGSHKGRHLFGVLLHLEVTRAAGLDEGDTGTLAIASCGNAALAAAVIARAAERTLDVFVPPEAAEAVQARLRDLGARVHHCPRTDETPGDPCHHAFRAAVENGAIPFCCQGPDCTAALDGGRTLGFEFVDAMREHDARLDRVFVQVGGGALASCLIRALEDAAARGVLHSPPRIHAVQTASVAPLAAAWERLFAQGDAHAALERAAMNRREVLLTWRRPRGSVAAGILDDDTYDGRAVLQGMLASGGRPAVVDEATLQRAEARAGAATDIRADATGTAGFAGALSMADEGESFSGETLGFLFTGVRR